MFIVGVKEVAEILNWSRKKVSVYHPRGNFPKPISTLSSGPVWFKEQIVYYRDIKLEQKKVYYAKNKIVYECFYNRAPVISDRTIESVVRDSSCIFLFEHEDIKDLISKIQKNSGEITMRMALIIDFNLHLLD